MLSKLTRQENLAENIVIKLKSKMHSTNLLLERLRAGWCGNLLLGKNLPLSLLVINKAFIGVIDSMIVISTYAE